MANINPTGIDELEEKKWLISRIDLYHKTIIEEFQNDRSGYEYEEEQSVSKLRSYRSYVLSGLGVFLTVILGYNSVYPMQQWIFFTFLTGLGVSGLIVIIFYNWLMRLFESVYAQIIEILTDDIGNLGFSHGYMITSMSKLSESSLQFVQNYLVFSILLTFAISVRTSKSFKQLAKEYSKFPQIESSLLDFAKIYDEQNEYIPQYCERLDRSQKMPSGLLKIIDETLTDYRPESNSNAVVSSSPDT